MEPCALGEEMAPSRGKEDRRLCGEEVGFEYTEVMGRKFSGTGTGWEEVQMKVIKG